MGTFTARAGGRPGTRHWKIRGRQRRQVRRLWSIAPAPGVCAAASRCFKHHRALRVRADLGWRRTDRSRTWGGHRTGHPGAHGIKPASAARLARWTPRIFGDEPMGLRATIVTTTPAWNPDSISIWIRTFSSSILENMRLRSMEGIELIRSLIEQLWPLGRKVPAVVVTITL